MAEPAWTPQHPTEQYPDVRAWPAAGVRTAPGRGLQLTRLVVALLLVVWAVTVLREPVETPLPELEAALSTGRVQSLQLTRSAEHGGTGTAWHDAVWTDGGLRSHTSRYSESWGSDAPTDDELDAILDGVAASPREVTVEWRPAPTYGMRIDAWGLAGLAAFVYLVAGPAPRVATRWAWFWLALASPAVWLVYVLLEPVPLGSRTAPVRNRLTGGWAFLLALVAGAVLRASAPGLQGLLWS